MRDAGHPQAVRRPQQAGRCTHSGPGRGGLHEDKRGIGRVILGGMSANLCVEAHLRELLEQGFEVIVVKDATAAAKTPDLGDGYAAALTNFRFIANAVVTTAEAIGGMGAA